MGRPVRIATRQRPAVRSRRGGPGRVSASTRHGRGSGLCIFSSAPWEARQAAPRRPVHAAPTLLLRQSRSRRRGRRRVCLLYRTHQRVRGSRPRVESVPQRLAFKRCRLVYISHAALAFRFSRVARFSFAALIQICLSYVLVRMT